MILLFHLLLAKPVWLIGVSLFAIGAVVAIERQFEKIALGLAIAAAVWLTAGMLHQAGYDEAAAICNRDKVAELQRESGLKADQARDEAALRSVTSILNDTSDQLEKVREDAQAKTPVPADCADSSADVGGLRALIRGK